VLLRLIGAASAMHLKQICGC